MNLTIDNALAGINDLLRDRISPEVADPFASQMLRLSCLLLKISANWVDDAAEIRVTENAALRAILADAAALLPCAELQTAAASRDPGLKLTTLDAENHRLRCLLVDAHAALETSAGDAARILDQRIWRLLEDIETRRAPRE